MPSQYSAVSTSIRHRNLNILSCIFPSKNQGNIYLQLYLRWPDWLGTMCVPGNKVETDWPDAYYKQNSYCNVHLFLCRIIFGKIHKPLY